MARQSLTHVEHSKVLDVVTEKYGIVTGETMLEAARNAANLFDGGAWLSRFAVISSGTTPRPEKSIGWRRRAALS